MEFLEPVLLFISALVVAVAVDWHMRGAGERRSRRAMHTQLESYLGKTKRI